MRKLSISRFWRCWRDAVLGIASAEWRATQASNNDAMRPPVPSKNGMLAFSVSKLMQAPMRALKRGYTIIELLVVMTVLGILATAAMPLVEMTAKRNKERELKQSLWEIRRAIDAYKQAVDAGRIAKDAAGSGYPTSLAVLAAGVQEATVEGRTIYLLRRIPKDPFAGSGITAEQSWGLRSYSSPPEEPKPGADVFDIYSKSDAVGMNGVPYRQW